MASTYNYNNPGAQDPRGNWEPQGALAGWNYQDKLQDFQNNQALAQTSSFLANMDSANKIQDWNQNAPVRAIERKVAIGQGQNTLLNQPVEGLLKNTQLNNDLITAKGDTTFRVWEAAQKLPMAQRQARLQELMTAATIVRGMGENEDLYQVLPLMQSVGLDTSRWEGMDGMARWKNDYQRLKNLDVDSFKQLMLMDQLKYKENQSTARNNADNDTRIKVAEIGSGKTSAAGQRVQRENDMDARMREILIKRAKSSGYSQEEAEDWADEQIYLTRARDAQYQQGARAQSSMDETEGLLGTITGKPTQPPTKTAIPPSKAGSGNPSASVQQKRNITQEEYDALPEGSSYYWNGQVIQKGKR